MQRINHWDNMKASVLHERRQTGCQSFQVTCFALELPCQSVNFSYVLKNMQGPMMINPCCGAIIAVADALNELRLFAIRL